jgi:hypothetical protein
MTERLALIAKHVLHYLRDRAAVRAVNTFLNAAPFPEAPAVELMFAFEFISSPYFTVLRLICHTHKAKVLIVMMHLNEDAKVVIVIVHIIVKVHVLLLKVYIQYYFK